MKKLLPDEDTMYEALLRKDSSYEGIFFVGVKTTGIFCRPTCTAKKPKKENVEFFNSTGDALLNGYRSCKVCEPLTYKGGTPGWIRPLLDEISKDPDVRLKDYDLKKKGLDPNRVRRWFKNNHGMTFQGYLRTLRITEAFGRMKHGEKVISSAFGSGYGSLSGFTESFKKATGFSPGKSRNSRIVFLTRILSPLGPMIAGASDNGLCLLEFTDRRMIETQLSRLKKLLKAELLPGKSKYFDDLDIQLNEYFQGKRKDFTIPLEVPGTLFQKKAWSVLQDIKYGTTRSYKEQAEKVGNVKAVRAVARANGENRIAILIPCHRVIGSDGQLTGYGGGLWRKKYMLDLEQKNI